MWGGSIRLERSVERYRQELFGGDGPVAGRATVGPAPGGPLQG
jgi:hypothetical protein